MPDSFTRAVRAVSCTADCSEVEAEGCQSVASVGTDQKEGMTPQALQLLS